MHSPHDDISEILFTEERIHARVQELGAQIAADHPEGDMLVVGVLRGAVIFMADLVRAIDMPLEMDFVVASSYGLGATTSGVVEIHKDVTADVEGRHVLVVEDILDSGLTLNNVVEHLRMRNPASVEIAALLVKNVERRVDIECSYSGFECPDGFIVGYGLDYAQRYRNLPYLGILKKEIYQ